MVVSEIRFLTQLQTNYDSRKIIIITNKINNMYNSNSPSNWSWQKAFDEMDKYVNQTELTQQSINHVLNYPGEANGVFMSLSKSQQDDVYEILSQIL
jgi:hypothetical protein